MNSDAAYLYNVRARSTSPACRLHVARSYWHHGQAAAEPPKAGCPQAAVRHSAPSRLPAAPAISAEGGSPRSFGGEGTRRREPTSQRAGPSGRSPIPRAGSGSLVRASGWTMWRSCRRCRSIDLMVPHLLSRRQPLVNGTTDKDSSDHGLPPGASGVVPRGGALNPGSTSPTPPTRPPDPV